MYGKSKVKNSFKEFGKALKEDKLPSVILMHGNEQYLAKWAVDTLVKKYVNPASISMDYVVLDDEIENPNRIIEACETFSMFSEKRIICVKDYKALESDNPRGVTKGDLDGLCDYLENSNSHTILIFSKEKIKETTSLYKTLSKNGAVYNFETLQNSELISFAVKRFKSSGVEISPALMRVFIDETGYYNKESDYRLYNFENDILKVIAHSDGIKITEDDILKVVSGDMDTFVFSLLDGITNNQKDKAFEILNTKLHEGEDIQPLIGTIISQFELILSIKEMRNDGLDISGIHKIVKGSEYRIKKLVPYANKYSIEKLKEILSNAYDVQWNIFSGLFSSQLAMEMFIARI